MTTPTKPAVDTLSSPSVTQGDYQDLVDNLIEYYNLVIRHRTASTAYVAGNVVQPTIPNGYVYQCTTGGTTGAGADPTWPTTPGGTVADGGVTWTCRVFGSAGYVAWADVDNKPTTFAPPVATASVLGGVMQGAGIAIDGSGVISTVASGGTIKAATVGANFGAPTAGDVSGTYSRTGTTVTVTLSAHGHIAGNYVYLDFTSGGAADGWYVVQTADTNTFTVTTVASGSTSGNVYMRRIRSYGTATIAYEPGTTKWAINFPAATSGTSYTVIPLSASNITWDTKATGYCYSSASHTVTTEGFIVYE